MKLQQFTTLRLYIWGLLFLVLAFPLKCDAQGTIVFANRFLMGPSGAYNAPVTLPDGSLAAGEAFTAGLFLVRDGEISLFATAPFASVGGLIATRVVSVPGISWGESATVRMRVWETSAGSYENAIAQGLLFGEFATGQPENNLLVPVLGGDPRGVLLPALLSGLQPLTLVPEPSTWALLLLAGGIAWCGRRRGVSGRRDLTE